MELEIPRCSIFRIYRFHGKTNHPICSYLPEYLGSREYFSSRLFELANSRTNRIVPLLVTSIRASFHSSFDSARSFPGSESISQDAAFVSRPNGSAVFLRVIIAPPRWEYREKESRLRNTLHRGFPHVIRRCQEFERARPRRKKGNESRDMDWLAHGRLHHRVTVIVMSAGRGER